MRLTALRWFTDVAGSEPALRLVHRVWSWTAMARAATRRAAVDLASSAGLATAADLASIDLEVGRLQAEARDLAARVRRLQAAANVLTASVSSTPASAARAGSTSRRSAPPR